MLLTDLPTKRETDLKAELARVSSPTDRAVCNSLISEAAWAPVPGVLHALSQPGAHHALGQLVHRDYSSAPANSKPAKEQVETKLSSLV